MWRTIKGFDGHTYFNRYYHRPDNPDLHKLMMLLNKLEVIFLVEDFVDEWEIVLKEKHKY